MLNLPSRGPAGTIAPISKFATTVITKVFDTINTKRKINYQKEIAKEYLKQESELMSKHMQLEEAIAHENFQLQIELFQEERKLRKEMVAEIAKAQKETALENTREQIEKEFNVNNFPLYIRKSNYANALDEDIVNKVKIVFSPPSLGNYRNGGGDYEGSDIIMTSQMTQFLQDNVSYDEYEYLGSAWRDDRFRAQSAYRSIFNEFGDQPFLILDCDILRNSFNFRICFWAPGSANYCVQQIITDFKTDKLLMESARNRAKVWRDEVYTPLQKNGMTREELKTLFPDEMSNETCLEKEEKLQKIAGTIFLNAYSYNAQDYNYCIHIISQLNGIAVGIFLDLYHMSSGNIQRPKMLKKIPKIFAQFPNSQNCRLKKEVANWVIEEYISFVEYIEKQLKEKSKNGMNYSIPMEDAPTILINCKMEIVYALIQLSYEEDAKQFLEEILQDWCQYMLGIQADILFKEIKNREFYQKVLSMMLTDGNLAIELSQWYRLSNKMIPNKEVRGIKKLLDDYKKKNF